MKKVLIVITTKVISFGGLFTVINNYLSNMDRTGLSLSLASTNEIDDALKNDLASFGVNYYCLGDRNRHAVSYYKKLHRLLTEKKIDIIHVNGNSATMVLELFAAKKAKVPVRIAHCHTTRTKHAFVNFLLKPFFLETCTIRLAASRESGDWLYGKKPYSVFNNAINVDKFRFSPETRHEYREALNIDKYFVIGTIGKINKSKNHIFLIDVLKQLKNRDDCILLIVGSGPETDSLINKAKEYNVDNKLVMLGARTDNSELLQAMDLFVFPSFYEGFGMAILEAQCSGLPCIASEAIPNKALICENVHRARFDPKTWADLIKTYIDGECVDRKRASNSSVETIRKEGLSIKDEAYKLRSIYIE